MKNSFVRVLLLFSVLSVGLTAGVAKGDMLSGDVLFYDKTMRLVDEGTTENVYVAPLVVDNHTTGQTMLAFCGDFRVNTSPGFGDPSTGQAYGAHSLFSDQLLVYSDVQKGAINDLFGHVYSKAFDETGSLLDKTYAVALQLALWEVLTESGEGYGLDDGAFHAEGALDPEILALTDAWFEALFGDGNWDGYDFTQYDMTVYVADGGTDASQTLISITPPSSVVPEPASLAIFGLGLTAIMPYVRRKMKK